MTTPSTFDPAQAAAAAKTASKRTTVANDMAMLRAARDLTKDLAEAKPQIYWPDMLLSAGLGYGGLAGAILFDNLWLALGSGFVAVLALYRALLFIHELSHIHRDALPGFRTAWNLLIGIPMLTPSFMYGDTHVLHHKHTQYGTKDDPEYLPLALMKPWSLPLFVVISLLAPPALLFRFAVLNPLGSLFPKLRTLVWERASALAINPDFRRKPPAERDARTVLWTEAGGTLWSWALIGSVFALGWRPLLIAFAIFSIVAVLNQVRTLVAHLWENDGEAMSVTAQYLDSVNVPPPGLLAEFWAPVGLRYHALHHLMPSIPYHSLAEAHRRLSRELGAESTYQGANYKGLTGLVARLARSTMVVR